MSLTTQFILGLSARFSIEFSHPEQIAQVTVEIKYGYYTRNTGLDSHIVSMALTFKKKGTT